jgi:hypothetical protein
LLTCERTRAIKVSAPSSSDDLRGTDACPAKTSLIMAKPGQDPYLALLTARLRRYGVTTGQAVAPLVVQTMRPWIAGLIGVLAAM